MVLVAPLDHNRNRPFRILDGESEHGPRLGGRAPEHIGNAVLREGAVYTPSSTSSVVHRSTGSSGRSKRR
jgi:hypothetical protein